MVDPLEKTRLARRIRAARRAAGITQQRLATEVGVTKQCVQLWESGRSAPCCLYVPALCRALSMTANDLLDIR